MESCCLLEVPWLILGFSGDPELSLGYVQIFLEIFVHGIIGVSWKFIKVVVICLFPPGI